MKPMLRRTVAALSFALLLAGCNRPEVVTALDHDFNLGVGGQALLPKDRLEVGFGRVVSDSRCPEGAACAQAGEAVVVMWLGPEGSDHEVFEVRMKAATAPDSGTAVDRSGYRLRLLALDPRPVAGQAIDSTAYKLRLSVSRLL